MNKNCRSCTREVSINNPIYKLNEDGIDWIYCSECEEGYKKHVTEINDPKRLEGKIKVIVKPGTFPVRLNGRRYYENEELYMNSVDFNEDLFVKIEA